GGRAGLSTLFHVAAGGGADHRVRDDGDLGAGARGRAVVQADGARRAAGATFAHGQARGRRALRTLQDLDRFRRHQPQSSLAQYGPDLASKRATRAAIEAATPPPGRRRSTYTQTV